MMRSALADRIIRFIKDLRKTYLLSYSDFTLLDIIVPEAILSSYFSIKRHRDTCSFIILSILDVLSFSGYWRSYRI